MLLAALGLASSDALKRIAVEQSADAVLLTEMMLAKRSISVRSGAVMTGEAVIAAERLIAVAIDP